MAMSVTYTTFNGMIVHENRGGIERAYVPDTLGSTQALIDDTETVTDTWEYWPYGEVSQRTGTNPTPFTFVGMLGYFEDKLDKLFYVRARHLRPDLARWLTVDPLWPWQKPYAYVEAQPTIWVDPSGLVKSRRCPEPVPGNGGDGSVPISCDELCYRDYKEDLLECPRKCKRRWWIWRVCMIFCLHEAYAEFVGCLYCCHLSGDVAEWCLDNPEEHLDPGEHLEKPNV